MKLGYKYCALSPNPIKIQIEKKRLTRFHCVLYYNDEYFHDKKLRISSETKQ